MEEKQEIKFPYTPDMEERRKKALEKAMEHEKSFIKANTDDGLIKKRMGSDLFK